MDTNSFLRARTEKQHLRYHQLVCGFYLGLDCGIPILCILVKFTVSCCGTMSSRVKDVSLIGKDSTTGCREKKHLSAFRPWSTTVDAMQAVICSGAVCSGHNDVCVYIVYLRNLSNYPPWERTYLLLKALLKVDFPFPLVGYVSSLEGISSVNFE